MTDDLDVVLENLYNQRRMALGTLQAADGQTSVQAMASIAQAQVHATLAVAYATEFAGRAM